MASLNKRNVALQVYIENAYMQNAGDEKLCSAAEFTASVVWKMSCWKVPGAVSHWHWYVWWLQWCYIQLNPMQAGGHRTSFLHFQPGFRQRNCDRIKLFGNKCAWSHLPNLSCRRADRNFCTAEGLRYHLFVALIQQKTKGGEELHQVTELILFLFSPPGSTLVHKYHST